jgi:hypothetical protein
MARSRRPLTVNLNIYLPEGTAGNINLLTEGMEEIMAKIDEVQASFDSLDTAVREFIATAPGNVAEMQATIDQLRADDAVEDTKLDGLMNGITNLNGAIDALKAAQDENPHPDQTLPGDLPPQQGG